MRAVLSLALVLLALTLVLNHARALFPSAREEGGLADRALEIVVGAKGPLLPSARIGSGPERIGEAMRLGERTLVGSGQAGLRAAFLGPGLELCTERCFDVAHAEGDARALRAAIERCASGALLVLASSGRIEPADGAARAEIERALALLGARARPGHATPESWAMIALRLDDGWVPLAEGYSRDSGVALSFVLGPDLESYAGFQGDLALVRAPERREVFLEEELQHADVRTAGIGPTREHRLQGRPMPGILLPAVQGADGGPVAGRLGWRDVALDAGSGLLAWVGLGDDAGADCDGVVLEVRVDGELVEPGRLVVPGAPRRVLLVDLRRFAGRKVRLELVVEPRASATGDALLLGWPMLVHGYDRSPLEAWAGPR